MINLFCIIGLHPWENWSEPTERNLIRRSVDNPFAQPIQFTAMVQTRKCTGCNKFEFRRIST